MSGLFYLATTGTMSDAAEFLTQLFGGTLGVVFSYAINIAAIGLTIAYVIKAVMAFIKYKGESNPNQAEFSKKEAINCLIVAGVRRWKENKFRKPLIIEGARQVGKTWLMKEFGKTEYEEVVYINFDSNRIMAELFEQDLDSNRIVEGIELYSGKKIVPDKTLLIFDEIQEVPKALSSLKYFYENAPQYHIVCAGSLLGIALHGGTSFPVGKVDFLKLYPLSFKEFLMATDKEQFAELLDKRDFQIRQRLAQTPNLHNSLY